MGPPGPDPADIRDALINMIVYQGDTEFTSVEQQRYLFESAPLDWDRRAITHVMIEGIRSGSPLLVDDFGYSGKVGAEDAGATGLRE